MGLIQWIKRLLARPPRPQPPLPRSPLPTVRLSRSQHGVSPFPLGSGPARIIVLRHAEKSGDRRDPHLSLPGRQRAEQLVEHLPATFGRPDFLIAARTSIRSRRPVETLEPLAAALAFEVRAKFPDADTAALLATLRDKKRYRGKLVVISWRHSTLPRLIEALGAAPDTFPQPWDESDYATVIELTYPGDGTAMARRLLMPF